MADTAPEFPRPLEPGERDALLLILDNGALPARDALLAQAMAVIATGRCECGCASIELAVDDTLPPATETRSPLASEATILDAEGEPAGGLLLFLEDGYLSYLEVYGFEGPVMEFPPVDRLQPVTTRG